MTVAQLAACRVTSFSLRSAAFKHHAFVGLDYLSILVSLVSSLSLTHPCANVHPYSLSSTSCSLYKTDGTSPNNSDQPDNPFAPQHRWHNLIILTVPLTSLNLLLTALSPDSIRSSDMLGFIPSSKHTELMRRCVVQQSQCALHSLEETGSGVCTILLCLFTLPPPPALFFSESFCLARPPPIFLP